MHWISRIYRTNNLAFYGGVILILLLLFLTVGWFCIPDFKPHSPRQMLTLNGNILKYDDTKYVDDFYHSIICHQGYLCLGTSETGSLPGGNYYNFLQNDPEINKGFSVLAGAGRTCGTYLPILLNHREQVKGLNIIYFINPVYWRTDLCYLDDKYWKRYIHVEVCKKVELQGKDESMYNQVVQPYYDKINIGQTLIYKLEYLSRKIRAKFFEDLTYLCDTTKYYKGLNYLSVQKSSLNSYRKFGKIDTANLNTVYNVNKSFVPDKWLNNINLQVDYRYRELESFIYFCKLLEIRATYIIGPYNQQFIEKENASYLKGYKQTVDKIKELLIDKKVPFIDACDISNAKGAFIDNQHHSSFGAYLIYKKIKNYFYEKNND